MLNEWLSRDTKTRLRLIEELFKFIVPKKYFAQLKLPLPYLCLTLRYFGFRFVCPCCGGHFRTFLPGGVKPRPNARCPRCDTLERHRLLWLYLRDRIGFFNQHLKLLYVAPTRFFLQKFQMSPNIDCISVDISSNLAMVKIDLTNIPLLDNQFDCIICNRVLEHIVDDRRAMRELLRILKPGGWAILQVPIDHNRSKTFEDPDVVLPEDRERVFGQSDHVRIYGLDYVDRLREAGFNVKVDNYVKSLDRKTIRRYSLPENESIYFSYKPISE